MRYYTIESVRTGRTWIVRAPDVLDAFDTVRRNGGGSDALRVLGSSYSIERKPA